ncbi:Potassium voltage-gated channel sub C member 1 [Irineochytrium annulatum]|nr:Potassium voltage-gated channel sub C member 1 [Irineochytrium annulatum]
MSSSNSLARPGPDLENARIVLNVGGTRFETYHSTLMTLPDTLLSVMFSPRNLPLLKPDARGEFFFDRSALCFHAILDFYRGAVLECPPTVAPRAFMQELQFWQIPADQVEPSENEDDGREITAAMRLAGSTHGAADARTLERTLMMMDMAESSALTELRFTVDLDGAVSMQGGHKPALFMTTSQKLWWTEIGAIVSASCLGEGLGNGGSGRLELFIAALHERMDVPFELVEEKEADAVEGEEAAVAPAEEVKPFRVLEVVERRKIMRPRVRPARPTHAAATGDPVDGANQNAEEAAPEAPLRPRQPSYISCWECVLNIL